jgi:chromosome segregation protein
MRLQGVTLFGFKSFADRTDVRILPGITAIVGPNGCGKSNISDALRWALGEQSPKALRGHRMEDVIFHGSASRRPLGLSEVLLTFSNESNELSVPWSEVGVGRRLYRDGESEYLLNKTVCRLKDIHDLFLGTGVNPKAYALMEQERLAHILTAKPLDRRVFVEEAAGITRYKLQRAETLTKLEATRQNLLRVKDVMEEVKRQLTSLERQAKKAQQHKALQAERRSIEVALLAAEHAALAGEEERLGVEETAERQRAESGQTRVAALGAALELARADAMAAEQRAADARHALQRAELELEGCVARAEQVRLVERDLGIEVDRLHEEAEALSLRVKSLVEERRAKGTLLEAVKRDYGELQARARAEEAALDELRVRLRGAREAAEGLRHDQVGLAGHRTELGQILGALDERHEHLQRRLERLKTERGEADAERARIETARGAASARVSAAAARLATLEVELRELATDAGAAAAERTAAAEAADTCRVTLAARRSSRAALEELEAQRAGYAQGVQAVFAAAGEAQLRGVVGTVADLLDVPRELERAVEAALGERLQWVVMETFEAAKTALGYLARSGGGQATFLPLDWLNGSPEAHVGTDPGVVGLAEALVASGHPRLVANLLGSVVVVRDLGAAERLYSQNGHGTSFVTVGGEMLSPPGVLGGGRAGGGGDASLLARKRAIRDLTAEIRRLEAELEEAQERGRRAEARVAALDESQRTRALAREAAEADRLTASKDLEQVVREAERVGLVLEALRAEMAQLRTDAAAVEGEARTHRQTLAEVEARATRVASEIGALLGRIETDAEDEARRSQAFLDAQVDLAALAGRIDTIQSDLVRNHSDEAEAQERIRAGEERLVTLRGRLEEGAAERGRLDARAESVRAERDQTEAVARTTGEAVRELNEAVTRAAEELRATEIEVHRATRTVQEHAIRLAELRVKRQDLEADARRRFEVEVDALRQAHDPARDLGEAHARLETVRQRIAALEPVNLIADEEYRELDERLGFLRTQHDDLASSMRDLEKALRGMTRTAQERFLQAFEEINRNFQGLFTRLFEGGRAELRLVEAPEGGDPLETGIEMVAQPRGKRLQAISLLSGGEKALTGLALLFAIFYYRPSPFCLLDEVDAPLDDANIHRFTRVLRELSSQTQFIVITHNRKTMEAADVLYGVTMEEPGLSRIVSVNLA